MPMTIPMTMSPPPVQASSVQGNLDWCGTATNVDNTYTDWDYCDANCPGKNKTKKMMAMM